MKTMHLSEHKQHWS